MILNNTVRHLLGYAIGLAVAIVLIPLWQYNLAIREYSVVANHFLNSFALQIGLALPFAIMGIIFAVWSNYFLFSRGEGGPADIVNLPISPRTKKLVISGPYRYSRNPMLFGAVCLYIAVAIYFDSLRSLMVALGFLVFMVFYVKYFEEKRLSRDFGHEYAEYKQKTSMIFPWRLTRL